MREPGIKDEDDRQSPIQHDQVFDDGENDRLEMAHGRGRAYQFRRLAKVGASAGVGDFATCFPADHYRSSKRSLTGSCFEGQRFARECGLIDLDMSVGEPHIGWHDVSHTDVNEVARDQVFGREQMPLAVAQHPGFYRQPLPQEGERILSPVLL